jgi:DNA-binding NtrC family response regulator
VSAGSESATVLVVEDDEDLRALLVSELDDLGYRVTGSADRAAATRALESATPDLVLSDMRLPDGDGLDILTMAKAHQARPAVIMITAFGTVPQAVAALKAGADDFLTKPLDLEHLAVRVARVLQTRNTEIMLRDLRENLRGGDREHLFNGMVGRSAVMRKLFDYIRRIAQVDEAVLISGESGTGKELVARAIHGESARASGPFIAINCASVPEHLLEAEFFGHTANAFTGAGRSRAGLFTEAHGGTLFLDEIGEMPPSLQAKLLRVLEDGRVRPLGSVSELDVDVRILAATNRDLERDVREGRWREDLYFRLETLTLRVPPLRERGSEDRLALAGHILAGIAADRGLTRLRLSPDAYELIARYPFPGNVRELGNALARAATFCRDGVIEADDLPGRMRPQLTMAPPATDPLNVTQEPPPTLAELEQRYIRWILGATNNNKKRAAEILGVGRRTIYRKLAPAGETGELT